MINVLLYNLKCLIKRSFPSPRTYLIAWNLLNNFTGERVSPTLCVLTVGVLQITS